MFKYNTAYYLKAKDAGYVYRVKASSKKNTESEKDLQVIVDKHDMSSVQSCASKS